MILADTSALYSLAVRREKNHEKAAAWYAVAEASGEALAITQHIIAESWGLVASRQNTLYADKLWEFMVSGAFNILDLDPPDLALALDIRRKYSDSGVGFVDVTSLAACERYRISRVFTFDRIHFGIYRPSFTEFLVLDPEI